MLKMKVWVFALMMLGGSVELAFADHMIPIATLNPCPGTNSVGASPGIMFMTLENPIEAQTQQTCAGGDEMDFPDGYPLTGNWFPVPFQYAISGNYITVAGVECKISWYTSDMFVLQDPNTCEMKFNSIPGTNQFSAVLVVHQEK